MLIVRIMHELALLLRTFHFLYLIHTFLQHFSQFLRILLEVISFFFAGSQLLLQIAIFSLQLSNLFLQRRDLSVLDDHVSLILKFANSKGSISTFFKGITIVFTLFLMLPKTYQNFMDSAYTEICQKLCMKQSIISIGSSKILIKSLVSLMQVASMTCTYLSKLSESSTLISSEASSEDNFKII